MSESLVRDHSERWSLGAAFGAGCRLVATLREAVAGSQQDYTEGPIGRAVVLLAVPMVLEMVMESLFAVCDVYFVSRLSVEAVAAVGLTEAVVTLVYGVAVGMSTAATALVSRRIGEKDPEGAARATVQIIALGAITSVVIAVPGACLAPRLLALMGAPDAVVDCGRGYAVVILAGAPTILLLFLINAAFRGAGDASLAMRALWLGNGVNIVLDPCLIFGWGPFPQMGLTGAAVATVIGRGLGVVYQISVLARGRGRLVLCSRHLRLDRVTLRRLLRLSLGGIGQFLISTASWVGLVRLIGGFGSAAVAGYTIAIRIVGFSLLPSWGLGNSAATLVGQNLGANQPERAVRAVWAAGRYNCIFLLAVAAVFVAFPEKLIGWFTSDPVVLAHGTSCLRYVSFGYGFYAYGMVLVQAFNGAGDTRTPTVINFFCYWLFQIPLAYGLCQHTPLGVSGVFLAITIAESCLAVLGVVVFRRGGWRRRTV